MLVRHPKKSNRLSLVSSILESDLTMIHGLMCLESMLLCIQIQMSYFCVEHSIAIANIMFQFKDIHKVTWLHTKCRHWHTIDSPERMTSLLFKITQALRGVDRWSDHFRLRSKLKFYIRRCKHTYATKPLTKSMSRSEKKRAIDSNASVP